MSKKIALTALFTSFGIVLSYIETFIPIVGIPGVKLGLANLVIMLSLYLFGIREAFCINLIRILLSGFMFANIFSIIYSLAGAFVSFIVMVIAKKPGLSMVTVGILGGVFHNVGQIVVASFVVETYSVYSYIPVLIISGMITGTVIGVLSFLIKKRAGKYIIKMCKE